MTSPRENIDTRRNKIYNLSNGVAAVNKTDEDQAVFGLSFANLPHQVTAKGGRQPKGDFFI